MLDEKERHFKKDGGCHHRIFLNLAHKWQNLKCQLFERKLRIVAWIPSPPGQYKALNFTSHWDPLPYEFQFVTSTFRALTLPFPVSPFTDSPVLSPVWALAGGWLEGHAVFEADVFSLLTHWLFPRCFSRVILAEEGHQQGENCLSSVKTSPDQLVEADHWACGQAMKIQHIPFFALNTEQNLRQLIQCCSPRPVIYNLKWEPW